MFFSLLFKIKSSHNAYIPLCSCFDGRIRDRICSACSTSSPCSALGGAPQARGRNCGKAHSRSDRRSSDRSKKYSSSLILWVPNADLLIWSLVFLKHQWNIIRNYFHEHCNYYESFADFDKLFELRLPHVALYWHRADRQAEVWLGQKWGHWGRPLATRSERHNPPGGHTANSSTKKVITDSFFPPTVVWRC